MKTDTGTRDVLKERDDKTGGASGSFDGKGGTYPAEMIGDTVRMGNVVFQIGPREGIRRQRCCLPGTVDRLAGRNPGLTSAGRSR